MYFPLRTGSSLISQYFIYCADVNYKLLRPLMKVRSSPVDVQWVSQVLSSISYCTSSPTTSWQSVKLSFKHFKEQTVGMNSFFNLTSMCLVCLMIQTVAAVSVCSHGASENKYIITLLLPSDLHQGQRHTLQLYCQTCLDTFSKELETRLTFFMSDETTQMRVKMLC